MYWLRPIPLNYSQRSVKLTTKALLSTRASGAPALNFPRWHLPRDLTAPGINCAVSDCGRPSLHHRHRVFPRTDHGRLDAALIWEVHIAGAAAARPRGWRQRHLVMTAASGVARTLVGGFHGRRALLDCSALCFCQSCSNEHHSAWQTSIRTRWVLATALSKKKKPTPKTADTQFIIFCFCSPCISTIEFPCHLF